MTDDAALRSRLAAALPPDWRLTATDDLGALGGFAEVLQHRFIVLDLDSRAFDPLDVIRSVRSELMLNVPIFCFGGAPPARDAARLARADRFFERDEIVARLGDFCGQFGWGGG
jgi:hypothetical protein